MGKGKQYRVLSSRCNRRRQFFDIAMTIYMSLLGIYNDIDIS